MAALLATMARGGTTRGAGLSMSDLFSPWNRKRPRRPHTKYIVLHTTEGGEAGSLMKVRRLGEAHYFVTLSGYVYRIIDRSRIAAHAGRSMWEGHRNIDDYSIGVEVTGYHDRNLTNAQYAALRDLILQLRDTYRIPERNVLTHSMVAYGRPNRFHRNNHRGRKRCGMIFARPEVCARLGLTDRPARDSDVEQRRLSVADPELFAFLYRRASRGAPAAATAPAALSGPAESTVIGNGWTAWRIARERYDHQDTAYVFPDGTRLRGSEIRDWSSIPAGTRVVLSQAEEEEQQFEGFLEIGKHGRTPREIAGDASESATTIYFFPDGFIRTGAELQRRRSTRSLFDNSPNGTKMLVGYIYAGYVKTRRSPARIAGAKWNYPSTYYRYPDGSIVSGDTVAGLSVPAGTLVFFQY